MSNSTEQAPAFAPGAFPDGSVCWIDLGTPDIDAAQAFYSGLFGWTLAPSDPSGYRLAAMRGQLVAALGPADDPGVPYWTINVTVPDIRAAATRFADAGAVVIAPPTAAGPLGHYAVARDAVGAPILALAARYPRRPAARTRARYLRWRQPAHRSARPR